MNGSEALVGVTVDTSVYTKIGVIAGDGDKDSSENPEWVNPNESNEQGSIVVPIKSRATVLLKCILAELNGLYIDGIGYLQFDCKQKEDPNADANRATSSIFNRRSFFGHIIKFELDVSGISGSSSYGW